jgi:hypothetical protein
VRAAIRDFSSWQLGFPDSNSTMKRSPVPDRAASSVCVQPSALRFSRIAGPKSSADLHAEHLLRWLIVEEDFVWIDMILTDREAGADTFPNHPDREVSSLITTSKNEVLEIRVSRVVHLRVS